MINSFPHSVHHEKTTVTILSRYHFTQKQRTLLYLAYVPLTQFSLLATTSIRLYEILKQLKDSRSALRLGTILTHLTPQALLSIGTEQKPR